jgi:anti-sigma factor RsiW
MHTAQSAPHIHDDDLTIYVRGGLASKSIPALESHLLECEICQEALSLCVGVQLRVRCTGKQSQVHSRSEPRSEPRFETKDEAILQQLHPLSFERQKVKVIDVSRNGLGLLAAAPVFPGTIVQVRVGAAVELAEVRHCAERGDDGYRVGLRLQLPS